MSSPINSLAFFLLTALTLGAVSARAEIKVGDPFPALSESELLGTVPDVANKVVLVDFWATWCGPCKESFPAYDKLQNDLAPRGFTVVGISVDKKVRDYDEFLDRFSPTFPTLRDGAFKLSQRVSPTAMPTCYLLDRHGVVRLIHTGFHGDKDIQLLREEIGRLLAE